MHQAMLLLHERARAGLPGRSQRGLKGAPQARPLNTMMELICKKTCSTCRKAVALLDAQGVEYRYREYTEELGRPPEALLELVG